jgi:23S rRNA pseudouridine1911/1915/1917 synthase
VQIKDPIISTPLSSDADEFGAETLHSEEAAVETRQWQLDATAHGQRLDKVLANLVTEFSRNYLQQLIEGGAAQLAGRVCTKSAQRLQAGQLLRMELRPTEQSQAFVPEPMDIEAVYEDAHILVINKPAGLVVHPAAGNWRGTLLNGLLARHAQAAQLPRAGIVHRLDKDTSGLMVVAKSRQAMDQLVRQIAAREVSRQYLALGWRPWMGASPRDVDAAIGRDPRNRLRMAALEPDAPNGKAARTTLALLQNAELGCLVLAKLHTGRTHQIRVHMAHIGHPLVADAVYGGAAGADMQRQALHAWQLAFAHPIGGEPLAFSQALPDDFAQALRAWRLDLPTSQGFSPGWATMPPSPGS